MPRTLETFLVFTCGVMRFDASGNLFVHLTHSVDAPHGVSIDGGVDQQAPPSDRRAKVAGNSTSGAVRGEWPEFTASLPRGLVVEVRGYTSVELSDDGTLTVVVGEHDEMPLWFEQGKTHLFNHEGETLRMWDKSSRPDIKKGNKTVAKKKEAPEKAAAKKAAPKKAAAKKAAPKKAVPKKAVPKKAVPKKAAAKAAPKKAAAKAAPKKAAAKAAPEKAAAKKAAPEKAAPEKAAPEKAAPQAAPSPSPSREAAASSSDPATQWAGPETSYSSDSSRSYDTGSKGPLGCLSLISVFAVGSALLALLLI